MENRDVVPITLNLSHNEACALAMVVRGISRCEFEGALQSWLNEHTSEAFPPDRSAGDNIVALCPSYLASPVSSARISSSSSVPP